MDGSIDAHARARTDNSNGESIANTVVLGRDKYADETRNKKKKKKKKKKKEKKERKENIVH